VPELSTAQGDENAAQLASLRDEISQLQAASEAAAEDHAAQLAEMRNQMEALAMRAPAEDDSDQNQQMVQDAQELVRAAQDAQETARAAQEKVEKLNAALVRPPGSSHLFTRLQRPTRFANHNANTSRIPFHR
jgi:membrane-bound lytic murein transglycosylase